MSSSSLSFQPVNPAVYRPSKSERTNNPFVSPRPNMTFSQGQILPQFSNSALAQPNDSLALSQRPVQAAQAQPGAKSSEPKSEKKEDKKAVGPLGFVFPVMTLIGTPMMLVTSLLGVTKNKDNSLEFRPNKGTEKIAKWLKKSTPELENAFMKNYKVGRFVLAMGIIPKSLIGIMYGIQAQQPSILLAHLMQLPLVGMILKENKTATTLVYLMGGLFTLGFINDVQNGQIKDKLPGSEGEKTRFFDMTRFKQAFALHSGLSFGKRISQAVVEFGKMIKFSVDDHIISSKRAFREVGKLAHGDKNELTDLRTTGSISKSSLGFMLSYAATIPALLSAAMIRKEGSKTAAMLSKYSMATTLLSGLMLNFGMILVALNGKNWAERVPMVGTSMELSGTVMGYSPSSVIQPIALALQQLGGGLNSIFFASKAQKD